MIKPDVKLRVVKYPTYQELIEVIGSAPEPMNFSKILNAISCEPDCIDLEFKLDRMVNMGMLDVQTCPDLGSPFRAWSVSELYS